MKILIVEDNFFSRTLLGEVLSSYGSIHIAVNGEEAVKAVQAAQHQKSPYQLICLDIGLPGMDGHDVLRKIRDIEHTHNVSQDALSRVIIVSAHNDSENVLGAFREQCDGYLVKPFDENKLRVLLQEFHLLESAGPQMMPS